MPGQACRLLFILNILCCILLRKNQKANERSNFRNIGDDHELKILKRIILQR